MGSPGSQHPGLLFVASDGSVGRYTGKAEAPRLLRGSASGMIYTPYSPSSVAFATGVVGKD